MALWHRGVKTVVEPFKRTPVNKNREYVVPYIEDPPQGDSLVIVNK